MRSVAELLDMSIQELAEFLVGRRCLPQGLLEALENDPRQGARQLAQKIRKHRVANCRETRRLHRLLKFEGDLWADGIQLIAGVDEVGVSPLAGPVMAGAVILPRKYRLPGLNDSKKVIEGKREELASDIKRVALAWSVARAEVEEIDRLNIYQATLLAMQRAVAGLSVHPEFVLVDARRIPQCPYPQRGIVHGDALSASIAAASIVAKTTRDAYMAELDRCYPRYGFAEHKGYPTAEHRRMLAELGACPVHRRSFAPVRAALGLDPVQQDLFSGEADPGTPIRAGQNL
jgi:ribonuclease HII